MLYSSRLTLSYFVSYFICIYVLFVKKDQPTLNGNLISMWKFDSKSVLDTEAGDGGRVLLQLSLGQEFPPKFSVASEQP